MSEEDNNITIIPFANVKHLWALGVGAVIGGNFFGWQASLVGGFMGLIVCLIPVSFVYLFLSFSIAELSTMFPRGGGPYVYALYSMGTCAGYFAGLAESLKVIGAVAVGPIAIGSYLMDMLNISYDYGPIFWISIYGLFLSINIAGAAISFRIQLFFTIVSIFLLLIFFIAAIPIIDYKKWIVEQDWVFTDGIKGIIKSLSFSLWFYFGIEELPLAIEETIEPSKNMPKGIIFSMLTLIVLAFGTIFFNTSISPGAKVIYESASPLLIGYKSVFGDNEISSIFIWLLIIGLVCSFHSFVFCMGRLLYAIARDGFFPSFIGKLHPTRHTPSNALIFGCTLGCSIEIILHFIIGIDRLGYVLINMAIIGAIISYIFQLLSFLILRIQRPDLSPETR